MLILLSLLLGPAALADSAGSEAKRHFELAKTAFALGNFSVAATEFEEAFKLKQLPELLYNAAQAHRLAGNHERAIVMYRNYINLYPKEKNIPEIRRQIVTLEAAVTAEQQAKQQSPTATVDPKQPLASSEPAPHADVVVAPPPPPPVPIYKRWWLWTIVGVGVAAAIIIPVAVVATAPPWADTTLGPGRMALGVRF